MINDNPNEPAMPIEWELAKSVGLCRTQSLGLSKREHFAGMALQGVCARAVGQSAGSDILAICAVQLADALLKELEK